MRIRPRNNLRFLLGNFKKLLKILFRVEINQLSALDSGLLIKIYILYYFLRTPLCVCVCVRGLCVVGRIMPVCAPAFHRVATITKLLLTGSNYGLSA